MIKNRSERAVLAAFAITLCCTATLVLSCIASKTTLPYTLSSAYSNANLSNRILVLGLPDSNDITIMNPRDVHDDYGGRNATPASRIEKYYLPVFVESIKSTMSGDSLIVKGGCQSKFSLRDFKKKPTNLKTETDSSTLHFEIPTKSSMRNAGLDSAVLICIDHLTFKRNKLHMEYYWDNNSKRPANLEVRADLVIWDYKNDVPVFFGTVTNTTNFQIAMNRKHWDTSARTLAKKIILHAKCL
ncbi:MAG: hypothetical protein JW863_17830 [Chitinispirillaceae bacterium]|nr:hypothetical protein [Chitinispirillaceae bacterium]